jgi:hypothetical protein
LPGCQWGLRSRARERSDNPLTYTKTFGDDRWAIHYYARIQGHELVTRRDLIPAEPDHPRAGNWYYALQLGPLEHKLPPIVAHRWRRVTFIVTSGDRFMNACKQNQRPFRGGALSQSSVGEAQRDGHSSRVGVLDRLREGCLSPGLALPVEDGWLSVTFGDRPGPADGLRFAADAEPDVCLREIQARLRTLEA